MIGSKNNWDQIRLTTKYLIKLDCKVQGKQLTSINSSLLLGTWRLPKKLNTNYLIDYVYYYLKGLPLFGPDFFGSKIPVHP